MFATFLQTKAVIFMDVHYFVLTKEIIEILEEMLVYIGT